MEKVSRLYNIFEQCIGDYHRSGTIDERVSHLPANPYEENTLEHLLYRKNQIDNVQWDLEDLIRDPRIVPAEALQLKRRIDKSNQERTDMVEKIDDLFLDQYRQATPFPDARLNTESIAWALDRLSILALKIYHMNLQAQRTDAGEAHILKCRQKLQVLQVQQQDLVRAIDELLDDIASGKRIVKVYRQMKMYNDPALNPVLYAQKNQG